MNQIPQCWRLLDTELLWRALLDTPGTVEASQVPWLRWDPPPFGEEPLINQWQRTHASCPTYRYIDTYAGSNKMSDWMTWCHYLNTVHWLTDCLTYNLLLIHYLTDWVTLVTNSIEQNHLWEANNSSTCQEIPRLSWNLNVHYLCYQEPATEPCLESDQFSPHSNTLFLSDPF
jgi:hypothetical protein